MTYLIKMFDPEYGNRTIEADSREQALKFYINNRNTRDECYDFFSIELLEDGEPIRSFSKNMDDDKETIWAYYEYETEEAMIAKNYCLGCYAMNPEHLPEDGAFNYLKEIIRIRVSRDSNEYDAAVNNSNIATA